MSKLITNVNSQTPIGTLETRINILQDALRRLRENTENPQAAAHMEVLSHTFKDFLIRIQAHLPKGLETSPCWTTRQLAKEFMAEGDRVYKRLPEMFLLWLPVMIVAVHFVLEDLASVQISPYTESLRLRMRCIVTAIKTGIPDIT